LQRVVDYDNSQAALMSSEDTGRRGNAMDVNIEGRTNNDSPCQSLLVLTDASTTKISGKDGKSNDDLVDSMSSDGEKKPGSAPNLYPSWDPRQTAIESLYNAIQHCQKHRERVR
jgi:hypothetical protein